MQPKLRDVSQGICVRMIVYGWSPPYAILMYLERVHECVCNQASQDSHQAIATEYSLQQSKACSMGYFFSGHALVH
jgi:hypothetical protein